MVRLNDETNYETPIVVCNRHEMVFKLDKAKTPIAYRNKVEEILEEGAANSIGEAEEMVDTMEFMMEIYYEKGHGLFAVEQDAAGCGFLYSPYSGDKCTEDIGFDDDSTCC